MQTEPQQQSLVILLRMSLQLLCDCVKGWTILESNQVKVLYLFGALRDKRKTVVFTLPLWLLFRFQIYLNLQDIRIWEYCYQKPVEKSNLRESNVRHYMDWLKAPTLLSRYMQGCTQRSIEEAHGTALKWRFASESDEGAFYCHGFSTVEWTTVHSQPCSILF